MTERHPDEATLAAWVSGALDDAESVAFEAHMMTCMHCAARLERAAQVEVAMYEVAAQVRGDRRKAASKRASMPTGLALAASLVLGLGLPGRWLGIDSSGDALWLGASGFDDRTAMIEATPMGEGLSLRASAPSCPIPDEAGAELCDDPTSGLEGALAMTMPEPDDGTNLCVDDLEGDGLACGVGEPVSG